MTDKYNKFNIYPFSDNPRIGLNNLTDTHVRCLPQHYNLLLTTMLPPKERRESWLTVRPEMLKNHYTNWLCFANNIQWLFSYIEALYCEYEYRFQKVHKSRAKFLILKEIINNKSYTTTSLGLPTPPPVLLKEYWKSYQVRWRVEVLEKAGEITYSKESSSRYGTLGGDKQIPRDWKLSKPQTVDALWQLVIALYVKAYRTNKIKPESTWTRTEPDILTSDSEPMKLFNSLIQIGDYVIIKEENKKLAINEVLYKYAAGTTTTATLTWAPPSATTWARII